MGEAARKRRAGTDPARARTYVVHDGWVGPFTSRAEAEACCRELGQKGLAIDETDTGFWLRWK
jgi:hypothetical protein